MENVLVLGNAGDDNARDLKMKICSITDDY